ncbi:T9SS type A sorting domain-containing protein, partial [candidate division WOR-3 bacterium]|nr:T9SS type A sorting domain-containing protein [candidate division WOR-3 bacterium]
NIDTPTNQATVEVFFAIPDPTNYGEGAIYLGATTPDAAGNWSITVTGLIAGDFITATTTDMYFNTSEFCTNFIAAVEVEEERSTGKQLRYELKQNHPNPFFQSSVISYQLPVKSKVSLRIFDVTGRHIRTLVTGDVCPGTHTAVWDGRNESGMKVSPGVYFYKLETKNFTATKKLILTK